MDMNMKVNGAQLQTNDTAEDIWYGMMDLCMRGIGCMIERMVREGSFKPMGMFILDIGKMI